MIPTARPRIVLAEDNYLVREGTRALLEDSGRVTVVAAVPDATALRRAVEELLPDALIATRMPPRSTEHRLTPRELEVLHHMAQGKTNPAIARDLHLSDSAIEKHINSIFSKLGLREEPLMHHRVKAVLTYLELQR